MKKKCIGTIIGIKNLPRTLSVSVDFVLNHPVYNKTYVSKRKRQVHVGDEDLSVSFNLGDKVEIISSRPYSATKRFLFVRKV